MREEDLIGLRGTFITVGKPGTQPNIQPDTQPNPDVFPICAGPWPNQFIGARQMRCACCNEFVALSPKGVAMHEQNPHHRPILCLRCFVAIANQLEALDAAGVLHG